MGFLLPDLLRLTSRKGFTLIETLVAMMILSISFVVIMQLFSGGLKSSKITTDYIYGIFHAREKMEEILLSDNLTSGNLNGDFDDGYEWTATVSLLETDEKADNRMPVTPAEVMVDVRWRNGERIKHFKIKTITLAQKPKIEGLGTDNR